MRLHLCCAIVLLAGGFVLADPPVRKPVDDLKIRRVKADIETLTRLCQSYKLRYDEYPEKLEHLVKPPSGRPFLDSTKSLFDPWGRKYEYDPKGKRNDGLKADIWAVTPDKKEIGNWPEKKQ